MASIPPERPFELLTHVKEAERMIVRGGGLIKIKIKTLEIKICRFDNKRNKMLYLGLWDDGLLTMLLVTVPIMLWLMVSVVVAARRAASFFLPSAAAFIGS